MEQLTLMPYDVLAYLVAAVVVTAAVYSSKIN